MVERFSPYPSRSFWWTLHQLLPPMPLMAHDDVNRVIRSVKPVALFRSIRNLPLSEPIARGAEYSYALPLNLILSADRCGTVSLTSHSHIFMFIFAGGMIAKNCEELRHGLP